jgi:ATP-binding cassette subfamily B protein
LRSSILRWQSSLQHSGLGQSDPGSRVTYPDERKHIGRIAFEHVTFAYVEGEPVLRDVSFGVEPGQRVAIVGATGAGKTTIVSLLLRFYDVQEGRITIGGVDIRDMDLRRLRAMFGLVLQDVHLFSGTIGGNVRLGNEAIDAATVRRAVDAVHAGHVRRSPARRTRDTGGRAGRNPVGRPEAAPLVCPRAGVRSARVGARRSDVQRRHRNRVAHSRCPQGSDARRTTIAIAHRLSTIQDMDHIIVLHKGELRESGTHRNCSPIAASTTGSISSVQGQGQLVNSR